MIFDLLRVRLDLKLPLMIKGRDSKSEQLEQKEHKHLRWDWKTIGYEVEKVQMLEWQMQVFVVVQRPT